MNQRETMRLVGSMQQLAYVRPVMFQEGRSSQLKAYSIKNGDISFQAMIDKCLDISEFSYKGQSIQFLSKPGLNGRNPFDTNGLEAQRSIMGGLFFTCGFENICAPYKTVSKEYPMHGRMRTTPAEHISADAYWKKGEYILQVSGEMREAELFGENMTLRRSIQTKYGERSVTIIDEVQNQSFSKHPMMLMYHFNIGYPLLMPTSKIILPSKSVEARDDLSKDNISNWNRMEPAKDKEQEYVFIHDLAADENGNTFAALINEERKLGFKLEFNKKVLPYFMEWKSIASGDYVLGLEPSNSMVYGREYHEKKGDLCQLKPFEKEIFKLKISILDGDDELNSLKNEADFFK